MHWFPSNFWRSKITNGKESEKCDLCKVFWISQGRFTTESALPVQTLVHIQHTGEALSEIHTMPHLSMVKSMSQDVRVWSILNIESLLILISMNINTRKPLMWLTRSNSILNLISTYIHKMKRLVTQIDRRRINNYDDVLYLLRHNNHFCYIKKIENFVSCFKYSRCSKLWSNSTAYHRHEKTCGDFCKH